MLCWYVEREKLNRIAKRSARHRDDAVWEPSQSRHGMCHGHKESFNHRGLKVVTRIGVSLGGITMLYAQKYGPSGYFDSFTTGFCA